MDKIVKEKPYKEYKATVTKIVDGDTVEVLIDMGFGVFYKDKLRFLDFDAPETFRPSCEEEEITGMTCKQFLKSYILDKKVILRTFKQETEKYGRILAQIFIDGKDIIQEMKNKGFEKKPEWMTTSIRTVAIINKKE